MSQRTAGQRALLHVVKNRVDRLWSATAMGGAYDEEDRIALREIAYSLEVAFEWVSAGKNLGNSSGGLTPLENFVNNSLAAMGSQSEEVKRLHARVAELEDIISRGGPGKGNRK
jgi:hypothetical protein